jgi:orotate phosphoribosyltransferase
MTCTCHGPNPVILALRELSVLHAPKGKPFILASGKKSMTYVDVRRTSLTADGLALLAENLYWKINKLDLRPRRVAGVALGGCPLASGVSLASIMMNAVAPGMGTLDVVYVRKESKEHGTGKRVEGIFDQGDKVVLIEDVVTSGKSSLNALKALTEAVLIVIGIVAVLDREEGGKAAIEDSGTPFAALVTLKELLQKPRTHELH